LHLDAGEVAAVFGGGGVGACCRYGVSHLVGRRYGGLFPLGTFLINVSGCLLIGTIATLFAGHSVTEMATALVVTGFLGGYTTFSTYAVDTTVLLRAGAARTAWLNLAAPLAVGLPAAAVGVLVGRALAGL
jgi:CrcB protein